MHTVRSALVIVMAMLGSGLSTAANRDPARTAFLVIAPDRGFLGNEEIREVFADFASSVVDARLAFITRERTEENVRNVWESLMRGERPAQVVAAPLFLSRHDALYERAHEALGTLEGPPITFGPPLGASYLAEEILFDRVEALASSRTGDEHLVVITAGADSEASESGIRKDLEPLVERAAEKYGLAGGRLYVLHDGAPSEEGRNAALERLMSDLESVSTTGARTLIVPFSLGMKYTPMMSEWSSLQRRMGEFPDLVSDGKGVLPHDNVGRWLQKSATRSLPLRREDIGVILVPHGADFNWNETMRRGMSPIRNEYVTEDAFSMVDPMLIESAVRKLEARGMRAALVVRIFFMEDSFRTKAEYVLGLSREYRGFPRRIRSGLVFHTVGGVEGSPQLARALMDRLDEISTDPPRETIILMGHGSGNDEVNDRWLRLLAGLAQEIREHEGESFRAIRYHTWREDWPDKRREAVAAVRADVEDASEDDGIALVVPVRTGGQGPAAEYLDGLKYRYATGFAPHREFTAWLRSEIDKGISGLLRSSGGTD
ncbi:MAG: hypothetical protein BMS9Abin37_2833 [Acidobacteriota bacterium]|nr:MAG: hypothetical protein BMS9Abin37_2833 [Acidobacteriota bacterium]